MTQTPKPQTPKLDPDYVKHYPVIAMWLLETFGWPDGKPQNVEEAATQLALMARRVASVFLESHFQAGRVLPKERASHQERVWSWCRIRQGELGHGQRNPDGALQLLAKLAG